MTIPSLLAAWSAVVALAASAPSPAPTPALAVDVRARALEPGELVRVVVTTAEPEGTVAGTLRGEALHFEKDPADPLAWSAWAVLDLDWPAGDVTLQVDAGGERVRRTLALSGKEFPQSVLKVEEKYVSPPPAVQERIARENARLAKVYAARSPLPAELTAFVRPVGGEPTSVFGARRVFNGQKRSPHSGLDLRAPTGTTVLATGAGRVALAADLYFSGHTVILDHGAGLFTVYAHLSRIDVEEGSDVGAGDPLGLSGATGRVTGPHLHWGAKVGKRIADPTALLHPGLLSPARASQDHGPQG